MRGHTSSVSTFLAAAGFVLTVAVWILLAPTQFGGQATYVIVNGNSMQPGLYEGDLVILRQADNFAIGDVVTYHSPDVGTVIHRIIDRRGDRYIFQGDNNDWVDSYQPTQSELIGKYWLYIPRAGVVLANLREPWMMALFVAVLGTGIVTPVSAGQIRKGRQRRRTATAKKEKLVNPTNRSDTDLLLILTLSALTAGLVALYAFTRPATELVPVELHYTQQGSFQYTADAPPGLYSDDRVQTGDPIFRKVINRVEISFDYLFVADEPGEITGVASWDALLISEAGWQRPLPLQGESAFSGNGTNLQAVLDLAEIQQLIDSVQLQTGVASPRYELRILPRVAISGVLGGEDVQDSFAPVLAFQLDTSQLTLLGTDGVYELEPAQEGRILRQVQLPSTIQLLAFRVSISALRTFSVAGALAAFFGMLLAVWSIRKRRRRPAIEHIRERFGPLLITVRNSSLGAGSAVVHLASIDDLAKVAERTGQMILCEEQPSLWSFSVYDEAIVYRFDVLRYGVVNGAREEKE